jgi:exosortase
MQNLQNKRPLFLHLLIIGVLLGVLYAPLFPELWEVWDQDPNYGHGLFVPLLACYLIWRQRKEIQGTEKFPYGPGLIIVLLGVLQYLVGVVGNELFTMRSSMVVVILGVLLTLWGKKRTKVLLFPVFYLLLMIPIPYIIFNAIAFPMKLFATKWAVFFIGFLRISVYSEGNIIHLHNTTLEVVNACSGLRSLMALFTFGLVFAYVAQRRFLHRGILVAAIFPIAIASNITRIIITALLAHYKGPETAHSFLHDTSGIVVYTVATILLFGTNEILRKTDRSPTGKTQSELS